MPCSNRIYNNFEEAKQDLKELIQNQEITIINGGVATNAYDDYKKKYFLSIEEKKKKIQNLIPYKEIFNVIIDTSADLKYSLGRATENFNSKCDEDIIIDKLIESIVSNKVYENYPNESRFTKLIETVNDLICNSSTINSDGDTYTATIKRLEALKIKVSELEDKNKILTDENSSLKIENKNLETRNENLEKKHKQIIKILNPDS
ncbi:MAG: hypothetical protein Q4E75_03495 [bacterium]|nr:hypothetical protein [bacterium]